MRRWTLRHPNAMAAFWAIAVLWFAFSVVWKIHAQQWGWLALAVSAHVYSALRFSYWWQRT